LAISLESTENRWHGTRRAEEFIYVETDRATDGSRSGKAAYGKFQSELVPNRAINPCPSSFFSPMEHVLMCSNVR
jgi:hypothetical protein